MDDITRYQLASPRSTILVRAFLCFLCSAYRNGASPEDTNSSFIRQDIDQEFRSHRRGSTQPFFPYVGVVTPKVHRLLFGSDEQFYQRVISTSLVSSSTALVVNPFETLMLKVRTGITGVNYFLGTDIWVEVPNIRFMSGPSAQT